MAKYPTRQAHPGKGGQAPFPMTALNISAVASQAFTDPRTGVACLTTNPIPCAGCWVENAGYNVDGTQNKDVIIVMSRVMPPPLGSATPTTSTTPVMTTNAIQILATIAPGDEKWVDTDDAAKLVVQRSGTLGTRSDAFLTRVVGTQ